MCNNLDDTSHASPRESWVPLHGEALYRYAFVRVRDRANAEDLVQGTFMAALARPEVCEVLEIASTNLCVLLHRARLRLRQCLEHHWFDLTVK
jgi:DNA-directed RNA polymerase specialized sigma24 family protein